MKPIINHIKLVLLAILMLGLVLLAPQIGFSAQDNAINIPAAAFTGDGFDIAFNKSIDGGYLETYDEAGCFLAPVEFPEGAGTISRVNVFILDNTITNATLYLHRIRLTGVTEQLGVLTTSGSSPDVQNLRITLDPTKTAIERGYMYQLSVCMSNSRFYGAKVIYTTP